MSTCPEHAATRPCHARLPVWETRLEIPSGPAPGPGPVLVPPPPDPASAPVNRAAPPVPPSDASHRSRPEPSLVASSGKPPAPPPSPVVPVPGPPRARPRARRRALTLALLSRLPPRDGGTCERRSTTRVAWGHVGSLSPPCVPPRAGRCGARRTHWLGEGLRRYRACTALTSTSSSSLGTTCSSSGSPPVAMTAQQPL